MKITLVQQDNNVGVDGEFRSVDLSAMDAAIHSVQFDTERATGKIEFDALATEEIDVRDLEAEQAQELPLREALERDEEELVQAITTKDRPRIRQLRLRVEQRRAALNALQPVMTKQRVPRRQIVLDPAGFAPFQQYVDAWRAAAPVPQEPTPPPPPSLGLEDLVDILKAKGIVSAAEVAAVVNAKPKG